MFIRHFLTLYSVYKTLFDATHGRQDARLLGDDVVDVAAVCRGCAEVLARLLRVHHGVRVGQRVLDPVSAGEPEAWPPVAHITKSERKRALLFIERA